MKSVIGFISVLVLGFSYMAAAGDANHIVAFLQSDDYLAVSKKMNAEGRSIYQIRETKLVTGCGEGCGAYEVQFRNERDAGYLSYTFSVQEQMSGNASQPLYNVVRHDCTGLANEMGVSGGLINCSELFKRLAPQKTRTITLH